MPFVKHGSTLIFYAHIPKCGGTSIETYLQDRFGAVALLNRSLHGKPENQRWSKVSPQHLDWNSVKQILPEEMIDHAFAVVRHPIGRLVSAFQFQRDVELKIPKDVAFSSWLREVVQAPEDLWLKYDNHFLPQTRFLPPKCTIFYMEHGLQYLVPYLDEILKTSDGPRVIPHENRSAASDSRDKIVLSDQDVEHIAKLYKTDFEKLGYDPNSKTPLTPPPVTEGDISGGLAVYSENELLVRIKRRLRKKALEWLE
ncbi:sulfotransferase family 2 domain-containing protein [Roseibium aggregatum]|uniref:Sulfotransferase family 2 domain-containing protein n=1 Tax=Roseibium aggregatum TaxID=187304 RepID=A0A939EC36_9HYPH|nr:sulfotransferase family 2 domain-containing protein [Roseibium aggregatum]MBN9669862.1 sulfotransferase family 2 domain-containing protein [Roseibium aggregatum]